MSDPPLSDIEFQNKMTCVWSTLNCNFQYSFGIFELEIDHHLQYANKTDSFISITAENRSNAIAALLERVYHIEMMNLYMHVARDLFTIAKSPIPNEDCIIALARIGGLYHKESSKLLHACHDIGNGQFQTQISN